MKFYINYKDSDAFHYALRSIHPSYHSEASAKMYEVFGSLEYITIELDLDTGEYKIVKKPQA